eukprot:1914858-Prymnesium_polylepis.2
MLRGAQAWCKAARRLQATLSMRHADSAPLTLTRSVASPLPLIELDLHTDAGARRFGEPMCADPGDAEHLKYMKWAKYMGRDAA